MSYNNILHPYQKKLHGSTISFFCEIYITLFKSLSRTKLDKGSSYLLFLCRFSTAFAIFPYISRFTGAFFLGFWAKAELLLFLIYYSYSLLCVSSLLLILLRSISSSPPSLPSANFLETF